MKDLELKFDKTDYKTDQLIVIEMAIKQGVDPTLFLDPRFDVQQMFCLFQGIKHSGPVGTTGEGDVSSYADPNLSVDEMLEIGRKIRDKHHEEWLEKERIS